MVIVMFWLGYKKSSECVMKNWGFVPKEAQRKSEQ
jgi:hypothetical protein